MPSDSSPRLYYETMYYEIAGKAISRCLRCACFNDDGLLNTFFFGGGGGSQPLRGLYSNTST